MESSFSLARDPEDVTVWSKDRVKMESVLHRRLLHDVVVQAQVAHEIKL
jgi:hypothetical protein